ncbi:RNA polymerase sigma-70 factor [Paenibacillus sp. LjRoot153]|uniref:RNA polymerase sigma-70 factor n=1 Tax=Paenibacillus sp. LjRoot153 TaxID=3342270 RepID=UPI003ECD87E8
MELESVYITYKQLLFSVAYRMLGSVSDAEDMLQDMFITLQKTDTEHVTNLKSYLVKMVTNRCLNYLNSASKQRETYIGTWLPEPKVTSSREDPMGSLVQDETISYAFLVLLQELSAVERAVFVLREVLGYEYEEVADMLQKTEANCRKIYSRAKSKINENSDEEDERSLGETDPLVKKFLHAVDTGDFQDFVQLLMEDAVMVSDGGGKARAAIHPIYGKERIAAFFEGVQAKGALEGDWLTVQFNGQSGLILVKDHSPLMVILFELAGSRHQSSHLYMIRNPDKLIQIYSVL